MNFSDLGLSICGSEQPSFLGIFDFSTAPPLLYYSYIPIIIFSFFIGFYVFLRDKKSLQSTLLFSAVTFFVLWVINILIQWVASYHTILMFSWQLTAILEVGMYLTFLYFAYVFLNKKDLSVIGKYLFGLIWLLVIILTPTTLNVSSYDIQNCEGIVGALWNFIYALEPAVIVMILLFGFKSYQYTKDALFKKQIILFTSGSVAFLTIFFLSNFYGEITRIYEFNLWGPLGMVVFLGFLAYMILKFRTFRIKVFSAQILVLSLIALIFSLFFVDDPKAVLIIDGVTFFLSLVFGLLLVRSVHREIEQREKIEKLAADLEVANARLKELDQLKSEFLSFASHQIRSPLTAIGGYTSMLLEGDFGEMSDKVKESVQVIDTSSKSLVKIVNEFLDISRIEQGRMKYEFVDFDAKKIAEEVVAELRPNVEKKKLSFEFSADAGEYTTSSDVGKIKQVIGNIVDNSIKYTPEGGIKVHVGRKADKILISVTDTGIGISQEDIPKLFSKFTRAKDANKTNVTGTGLGLYVAKQMLQALNGKIWVESPGKGKGSSFYIELQAKK